MDIIHKCVAWGKQTEKRNADAKALSEYYAQQSLLNIRRYFLTMVLYKPKLYKLSLAKYFVPHIVL